MNSQGEMCDCCTCGYKWVRGRDGSHSCATVLKKTVSELTAELEDLRQFKKEVDNEGVVPATRVLEKEHEVSELTAEASGLRMALAIANKSADDQMFQKREAESKVSELTARIAELEKERDHHVWVDGPHGSKYHCKRCGISKCEDHGCYDTCESWITREIGNLKRQLDGEASAWLKLKAESDELKAALAEARKDSARIQKLEAIGKELAIGMPSDKDPQWRFFFDDKARDVHGPTLCATIDQLPATPLPETKGQL